FYYIANGPLDSRLLHLRADGTFSFYLRTHFTIEERGKGTWRREPSGEFGLEGGWRRHVIREPLDIGGFGGKSGPTLMEIRKDISDFMKSQTRSTFSADESQQVGTGDIEEQSEGRTFRYTLVPISVHGKTVTRKDLEGLIEAIDAHSRFRREDLTHVTPLTTEAKTFLHCRARR